MLIMSITSSYLRFLENTCMNFVTISDEDYMNFVNQPINSLETFLVSVEEALERGELTEDEAIGLVEAYSA